MVPPAGRAFPGNRDLPPLYTARAMRDDRARLALVLCALLLLSVGALGGSLLIGQGDLSEPGLGSTFLHLRLGRFGAAYLAGACLAVGGVLAQGLFRNPLASPDVIGTTAGATFGGRTAIILQATFGATTAWTPELLVPIGCALGGGLALLAVLSVARWRDDTLVVLLAGFLLSSLFLSLSGFLTAVAQERWELGRAMIHFALGDVSGVGARQIILTTPFACVGICAAWFWARPLDMLASGEEEAASLGLNVGVVRTWCVTWVAVLTAGAVAVGGNVGFVGLVVPHLLRPFLGVRHRALVPAAAIAGGAYLVLCDLVTRVLPTSSEIPLGVVTGLIGAPLFLLILVRQRREVLGRE